MGHVPCISKINIYIAKTPHKHQLLSLSLSEYTCGCVSINQKMEMHPGDDMPMSNGRDHNSMKMHMSLYWGKDAIVLFSGWPKHSVGHYILAILFVFFLAIIAEVVSNKPNIKRGTNPIIGGLAQATFYVFRISLLYLVMLAVMSFNLGIFIAAVAGHTLGFFLAKSRALALANREQESSSDAQKV